MAVYLHPPPPAPKLSPNSYTKYEPWKDYFSADKSLFRAWKAGFSAEKNTFSV